METLHCYFDGACEPINPGGNMGIGAVILSGSKTIFEHSSFVPMGKQNSNNVAEYKGLITLLVWLKKSVEINNANILISGDSNLVVQQMNGAWKIKQGLYVRYAHEAKELLKEFPNIKLQWIAREHNYLADELSKRCMLENKCEFRIQKQ